MFRLLLLTTALSATAASAGSILIVNGSSTTTEESTTSLITGNLTTLHEDAGNTVTVVDGVPLALVAFDQIWDLRFSNTSPITAGEESQYLGFLQGGGGMFVMGENSAFPTRNGSVLSLIEAAGGGTLSFVGASDSQVVASPFDGPNALTSVSYPRAGAVDGFGTGQWITSVADGSAGTGVAFGVGDLANAPLGALTTIFDVNFMEGDRGEGLQNLTRNLIGFVEDEVDPEVVPLPAGLPLALLGLGSLAAVRRLRA